MKAHPAFAVPQINEFIGWHNSVKKAVVIVDKNRGTGIFKLVPSENFFFKCMHSCILGHVCNKLKFYF